MTGASDSQNLYSKAQWDANYVQGDFQIIDNDPIVRWMDQKLPWENLKSCFEVGCFPGGYLAFCGTKKLELSGVDQTTRTPELVAWLKSRNEKIGEIAVGDFFEYSTPRTFDLVYSHGFIEHFVHWPDVIRRHLPFVSANGYLVISTPNFSGWGQRIFHQLLDQVNLGRHFLPSMNPSVWKEILEKENFEVVFAGNFGELLFWIEEEHANDLQIFLFKCIRKFANLLRPFVKSNSMAFSPYCGVIARRRN